MAATAATAAMTATAATAAMAATAATKFQVNIWQIFSKILHWRAVGDNKFHQDFSLVPTDLPTKTHYPSFLNNSE